MDPSDPRHEHHRADDQPDGATVTCWRSAEGEHWNVQLSEDLVRLECDDASIEVPRADWQRDVYIAAHGDRFIVRFSTFEREVGFFLDRDEIAPLLAHFGEDKPEQPPELSETVPPVPEPDTVMARPVASDAQEDRQGAYWPRVSSLAMWALITAALVFVPFVGILAATATVVLLVAHRLKVPRTTTWRHSRKICFVATFLFLVGAVVNVVATRTFLDAAGGADGDIAPLEYVEPAQAGAGSGEKPPAEDSDSNKTTMIIVGLAVILISLTVHEAAHATSAWWLGDDFAYRLGRVTLNPLSHIDPFGTVILPLILYFVGAGVFGFARPVPVRLENVPRRNRAQILVAFAGPGSNLLLAAISLMLLLGVTQLIHIFAPEATVSSLSDGAPIGAVKVAGVSGAATLAAVLTLLKISMVINILLAFFNLIPIPPLDGSWILEHLFPTSLGRLYAQIRPYGFIIFLVLLYTDVLFYAMAPGYLAMDLSFVVLMFCMPV